MSVKPPTLSPVDQAQRLYCRLKCAREEMRKREVCSGGGDGEFVFTEKSVHKTETGVKMGWRRRSKPKLPNKTRRYRPLDSVVAVERQSAGRPFATVCPASVDTEMTNIEGGPEHPVPPDHASKLYNVDALHTGMTVENSETVDALLNEKMKLLTQRLDILCMTRSATQQTDKKDAEEADGCDANNNDSDGYVTLSEAETDDDSMEVQDGGDSVGYKPVLRLVKCMLAPYRRQIVRANSYETYQKLALRLLVTELYLTDPDRHCDTEEVLRASDVVGEDLETLCNQESRCW